MTDLQNLSQADLWEAYRHYNREQMDLEDHGQQEAADEMERRRAAVRDEMRRRAA